VRARGSNPLTASDLPCYPTARLVEIYSSAWALRLEIEGTLLGRRQVVRHGFLVAAFVGSNPTAPKHLGSLDR
jgi:hypothetical protein